MAADIELESIREVNKAIQTPSRRLSDAVILSVCALANSGGGESLQNRNLQSPFLSPLRSLQFLDIYGSICPNNVHLTGLAKLVELRGGVENIKLPGLAPTLC